MEADERVDCPAITREPGYARSRWNGVVECSNEGMAGVVVRAAVVKVRIERVGDIGVTVLRDDVQRVRPGVGELAGKAVPCSGLEGGLQRAVVGVADAGDFVDGTVVREALAVWAKCVLS